MLIGEINTHLKEAFMLIYEINMLNYEIFMF